MRAARAIGRSRVRPGAARRILAGLALLLPAAPATAQIPRVDVRWEPDQPVQGRLFRVVVNADMAESLDWIRAELAGQPLHFSEARPGEYVALAAAPIDAAGEMVMPVVARWIDGATDSVAMAVPVASGEYPLEKLTVAPRYGAPPDSALAALRFIRVPAWRAVGDATVMLGDVRYGGGSGNGFSDVRVPRHSAACPANVPPWRPPRADLLGL